MAFDFAAGVSALGNAVSDTAGKWTLQNQRDEAEKEKIHLADQLAGRREAVNREWQSGEKVLDRTLQEKLTLAGHEVTLKAAGIGAGATLASARMQIDARKEEGALDRTFRAEESRLAREEGRPLREAQVKIYGAEELAKTVAAQSAKEVHDAREEMKAAQESGDAKALAKAQQRFAIATFSSTETVQAATVANSVANQYRLMANEVRAKLEAASDLSKGGGLPENQARVKAYKEELAQLEIRWKRAVAEAEALQKSMPKFGVVAPSDDGVLRYDEKGNRITAPKGPNSLINSPPQ